MTINSTLDRSKPPQHWIKIGFYAIAVLFNLCLIAQLLTVGIAYFNDPSWWQIHVLLVRGYGALSLILFAGSAIVPFSKRIRSCFQVKREIAKQFFYH